MPKVRNKLFNESTFSKLNYRLLFTDKTQAHGLNLNNFIPNYVFNVIEHIKQ